MTDDEQDGNQPPPKRSRLEDEVREILIRTEQPASFQDHVRRKAQSRRPPERRPAASAAPRLDVYGPGAYLIGSLALAFVGMMLRDLSPLLAVVCGLGSVVLLAMMWKPRAGSPGDPNIKRWRGEDINLREPPPPPAWLASLRERFRRPPRL